MSFTKYLKYTAHGQKRTPDRLRFGGDSDSDSSVTTTNQTDNYNQNIDKRIVASEEAVALNGDGNKVFRTNSSSSTTTLNDSRDSSTYFADSSNRSSTDITTMMDSRNLSSTLTDNRSTVDSRNQSTLMFDSSNRSVFDSSVRDSSTKYTDNSVRTTTDMGSIGLALGGMGAMTSKALDVSKFAIGGTFDALNAITASNSRVTSDAFDLARGAGANALSTSAQVLGFASSSIDKSTANSRSSAQTMVDFATNAISKTNDAFAIAKDKGDSKTVMYALVAVAAIAIAFALKD